jgi:molecular chaperone DnaK
MANIAIGIDLGTSNSCIAAVRDGTPEVLSNGYGEATTASVVAFQADGTISVGNSAKANIIHDPKNTVSSAKRLIGRYFFSEEVKKASAILSYQIAEGENHGIRIPVRDEEFSLPEIGAMVLREMKSIAEARLGQPVTKAVITVPANFNDNQRQATRDSGRIAGLEVLRILNEPTAAALAYGFGKGLSQRVAVYDLGGGTFDISVLEIGQDVFEVLSTRGDTFLGGDDFDDRVIDLLADEFQAEHGINLRNDPFALETLKVAAEGAKKALSVDSEVEIRIPEVARSNEDLPLSIERKLTESDFANLVNDLIQTSFKVCDEALQQAGVLARDLDGVILVGGPTRLPVIRRAVSQYFQQEPRSDVDPDQVVAMGAAIHAHSLESEQTNAYLLDVTPLSLRVGVAGGLAETIIERNTPVPIEQTRTFTTFRDNQESVKIRIYQGESRQAEENELLGQFEFSGFRSARRGDVQIDITFEINADGIVNVTARDRETGQQAGATITLSSGLSESDIQTITDDSRIDRVETIATDDVGDALAPPPPDPRDDAVVIGAVALKKVPVRMIEASQQEDDAALALLADDSDLGLADDDDTAVMLSPDADPGLDVSDEDLDLALTDDSAGGLLADNNAASEMLAEEDPDMELLPDDEALSILDGDPSEPVPLSSGHDVMQEQASDDSESDKSFFDSSGVDLTELRESGDED